MRITSKITAGIASLIASHTHLSAAAPNGDLADHIAGSVSATSSLHSASSEPSLLSPVGAPAIPLQASVDGSCGNGFTCSGSGMGRCCSEHGYCGDDVLYCGGGCRPEYGACGLEAVVGAASPPTTSSTTATTTLSATRTASPTTTEDAASVSTPVSASGSTKSPLVPDFPFSRLTINYTKTFQTTATAWLTQTSVLHLTESETDTVTRTKFATTVETVTSTVTATATFNVTSTSVDDVVTTTTATVPVTERFSETYTFFSTVAVPITETHNVTSTLFQTVPITQLINTTSTVVTTVPVTETINTTDVQSTTTTVTVPVTQTVRANTSVVWNNATHTIVSTVRTTATVNLTRIAISTSTVLETLTVNATAGDGAATAGAAAGCVPSVADSPLTTTIHRAPEPTVYPSPPPLTESDQQRPSPKAPTTSASVAQVGPTPVLPGIIASCKKFYKIKQGETCSEVAQANSIDRNQLRQWNPAIGRRSDPKCQPAEMARVAQGSCKVGCRELWAGYYVCVGV